MEATKPPSSLVFPIPRPPVCFPLRHEAFACIGAVDRTSDVYRRMCDGRAREYSPGHTPFPAGDTATPCSISRCAFHRYRGFSQGHYRQRHRDSRGNCRGRPHGSPPRVRNPHLRCRRVLGRLCCYRYRSKNHRSPYRHLYAELPCCETIWQEIGFSRGYQRRRQPEGPPRAVRGRGLTVVHRPAGEVGKPGRLRRLGCFSSRRYPAVVFTICLLNVHWR